MRQLPPIDSPFSGLLGEVSLNTIYNGLPCCEALNCNKLHLSDPAMFSIFNCAFSHVTHIWLDLKFNGKWHLFIGATVIK